MPPQVTGPHLFTPCLKRAYAYEIEHLPTTVLLVPENRSLYLRRWLAIAQSLPGVLAVNISILVGNKLRGLKGSLAATLGTILPSFLIILAIAIWFVQVYDNPVIERIFKGIRPAVVALIVSPVLTTAKTARINLKTVIIPIVVALAIWLGGISPIWFVLLGGIGGIVYYNHIITRIKKRYREKKK